MTSIALKEASNFFQVWSRLFLDWLADFPKAKCVVKFFSCGAWKNYFLFHFTMFLATLAAQKRHQLRGKKGHPGILRSYYVRVLERAGPVEIIMLITLSFTFGESADKSLHINIYFVIFGQHLSYYLVCTCSYPYDLWSNYPVAEKNDWN